ncbi:MAG: hypothetical protein NWF05_12020 [Candidatus Bathyarchaeota archaeon]|nr:hypothetical protein [Candidatus Bathyarchaeota archaeon]
MDKTKEQKRKEATIEFLKSGDILQLQRRLGHKHIRLTLNFAQRNGLFAKRFAEVY